MNVIGLCQGSNLKIFSKLVELISEKNSFNKIGIFVADADYYYKTDYRQSVQNSLNVLWLKEWESVKAGLNRNPDLSLIQKYENKLGAPSLWNAILADRRLQFGRYCKNIQQYSTRFTEQQLLSILTEALIRIEILFEKVKPDVVFGFVPVTLHEYLILRIAMASGIDIRLLRSTKIENYITLSDNLYGLSSHIKNDINNSSKIIGSEFHEVVDRYLKNTTEKGAKYEGIHLSSHALRIPRPDKALRIIATATWNELRRLINPEIRNDNHNPGYLIPSLIEEILLPFRAFRSRILIKRSNRKLKNLNNHKYCFFPLHFEPEIALQIYGRPLQNQIEVVRNIALSIPAGMKLAVKEHPRSAGHRSLSYYRKLLDIPNVVLIEPEKPSYDFVKNAEIVCVITGNVGMEAIALKKPVIVLGEAEYSILPKNMLRTCHNLYNLSYEIKDLLQNYKYDDDSFYNYLLGVVSNSVPVDLYSTLLGKGERVSYSSGTFEQDLIRLKVYINNRLDSI
jgi:hypothetical protein